MATEADEHEHTGEITLQTKPGADARLRPTARIACVACIGGNGYDGSVIPNFLMAALAIRDFDDALKQRLRSRVAHDNRSMDEEVRQIRRAALMSQPPPPDGLVKCVRVHLRFAGLGDVQLPLAEREPLRTPPGFGAKSSTAPASTAPALMRTEASCKPPARRQ